MKLIYRPEDYMEKETQWEKISDQYWTQLIEKSVERELRQQHTEFRIRRPNVEKIKWNQCRPKFSGSTSDRLCFCRKSPSPSSK